MRRHPSSSPRATELRTETRRVRRRRPRRPPRTGCGYRLCEPWGLRHGLPELVGDGIAAVAAEVAGGDLDARRGLAALVLGEIEQPLHLLHGLGRMAAG